MATKLQLVEEDQAEGRIREIYGDIKRTLNMPLVADIFRACAVHPPFLEAVWWEIKPLVGTIPFEGLADRLRAHAIACARQRCYVSDHSLALEARGIAIPEIERVREVVEMFHLNDPRLLVVASAIDASLAMAPVGVESRRSTQRLLSRGPLPKPQIELLSPEALPTTHQKVLYEIRDALDASFVPADFRAIAHWPLYLQIAWNDVKAQVRSAEFRRHVQELATIATNGIRELPRPVRIDTASILGSGVQRDRLAEIQRIVDATRRLLPGIVATIALLRLGLNSLLEDQLLELEAGA